MEKRTNGQKATPAQGNRRPDHGKPVTINRIASGMVPQARSEPPPLRVLYICYYPLTEPLVQTQVVAYLRGLARRGHHIHLLTFETTSIGCGQRQRWRRRLRAQGIIWHHLRYHKRPSLLATIYDVLCGVIAGWRIMRRHHLVAIHARSHVAATMGLILKKLTGCRLIFDVRGLLSEEYEDTGVWQRGSLPSRLTKSLERHCLKSADAVVVLTERVKHALFDPDAGRGAYSEGDTGSPHGGGLNGGSSNGGSSNGGSSNGRSSNGRSLLSVIPCCVDMAGIAAQGNLRAPKRAALGLTDRTVMVYVGKLSGWYLRREMVEFFITAQSMIDNLYFLVLTQDDPDLIIAEFERCKASSRHWMVTRVEPGRVGEFLATADFAISFIRRSPSKIASSPTKIGEYLAAGLPIVCNAGIGDVDAIIAPGQIGVLIESFTRPAYEIATRDIRELLDDQETASRCRGAASAGMSLQEVGVPRYHAVYTELARNRRTTGSPRTGLM